MRRGITLMEVLFAIGVVTVGLFGVVALYPVALGLIGQGHVADMSFRLGQDGVRDFEARGMARPDRWLQPDGNFAGNGNLVGNPSGTSLSFAIDPRFVARHQGYFSGDISTNYFPYFENSPGSTFQGTPRMSRITLNGTAATQLMRSAEADGIFTLNDELAFELPDDKLLPPVQQFGMAPARRQSEGSLSWLATLCPIIDTSGSIKDRYLLSIVVFNRRDPTFSLFDDFDNDNQYDIGEGTNERIAAVSQFYGSGLSGGEVELVSASDVELELKSNDWLMLMTTMTSLSSGSAVNIFRWYRVLETEEDVRPVGSSPTLYYRDVTLDGGDFPVPPGTSSIGVAPVTATLVSNVAYVYETTIRLETSGLWTD